jgi:hypothetical protein
VAAGGSKFLQNRLEDLEVDELVHLLEGNQFLSFLVGRRFPRELEDPDDLLEHLALEVIVARKVHADSGVQANDVDQVVEDDRDIVLEDQSQDLVQDDWIHELLGLALGLEILVNVLVELGRIPCELGKVLVVALDERFLDHDVQQGLVLAVLLAASLYHFLQEATETLNVLLVVRNEALVPDHFDEIAEGAEAADH